jgi:hypothetical protein
MSSDKPRLISAHLDEWLERRRQAAAVMPEVTSLTGAPTGRYAHTVVWTRREMVVWGGVTNYPTQIVGARYFPSTDT